MKGAVGLLVALVAPKGLVEIRPELAIPVAFPLAVCGAPPVGMGYEDGVKGPCVGYAKGDVVFAVVGLLLAPLEALMGLTDVVALTVGKKPVEANVELDIVVILGKGKL